MSSQLGASHDTHCTAPITNQRFMNKPFDILPYSLSLRLAHWVAGCCCVVKEADQIIVRVCGHARKEMTCAEDHQYARGVLGPRTGIPDKLNFGAFDCNSAAAPAAAATTSSSAAIATSAAATEETASLHCRNVEVRLIMHAPCGTLHSLLLFLATALMLFEPALCDECRWLM